ncbi:hypothetical protein [Streptomyces sp. NPDC050704]|uniref:hypothetical protein n=1 Tax=Streptomyces sp. NPDC050704 TaxID=3157219 RepID=UPI00342AEC41
MAYDSEDTLEPWHVAVTYGTAGEEEWEDEEEGGGHAPAAGSEIGHLILWRLRDYTGENRWEAADAESGDLEVVVSAVPDARGTAPRSRKRSHIPSAIC